MRKFKMLLGGVALAGVLAVGGSAFTAATTLPESSVVKGYGSQTITGVTATAVTYNTNTAGDTITSVGLVLTDDTTSMTIQIAFDDAAPATCTGSGSYVDPSTTYSCTVSQSVNTVGKFALVAN